MLRGRRRLLRLLPTEFASDPERLARFEQEARAAILREQDDSGTTMVKRYRLVLPGER